MKFKDIFLIAEIGINHNGSMSNVYKLIDMAKSCGCDAVKFQKRDPEITTPENQKNVIRETPWGKITYLDYKKKIELSSTDFKNIQSYCKKKKIIWFCSIWDLNSLEFIDSFNPKYYKIPSALLTNRNLVQEIAKKKVHIYFNWNDEFLSRNRQVVKIF